MESFNFIVLNIDDVEAGVGVEVEESAEKIPFRYSEV
jgi:hypothetical protein